MFQRTYSRVRAFEIKKKIELFSYWRWMYVYGRKNFILSELLVPTDRRKCLSYRKFVL